ncbi:hypothetical protein IT774_09080 [Salinimonas marina]|uniref:Lipoprotein n=1 Tax=Salinimonas marina TaxID=2785918 RepID=A0A7S9DV12_9ALTE|nr:hypothetical protein [Salinimonas marina]QPG04418.1 hypothetical protein IT774_09080 [Salinimonas marina]
MMTRLAALPMMLWIVLLLTGCNQDGGATNDKVKDDTPEHAALVFARSIYNDKNLDKALSLSTPRLQRILKNYHINSNVQRHVFNLPYEQVKIVADGGNKIGRAQFAENASVVLFFSGTYNDDRIEELRAVKLLRQDGQWKVDRVTANFR